MCAGRRLSRLVLGVALRQPVTLRWTLSGGDLLAGRMKWCRLRHRGEGGVSRGKRTWLVLKWSAVPLATRMIYA